MLTNRFRRPVFAAFALLVFSIFLPGFTKPERKVNLPDLQVGGQILVVKLQDRAFFYEFKVRNNGTARADLSLMKVKTVFGWEGFQKTRSDKYTAMRYDTPPNPRFLAPGEVATVRFKIGTDVDLPGFFVVDVFLDFNDSVRESNEGNNSGNGNSIGLG